MPDFSGYEATCSGCGGELFRLNFSVDRDEIIVECDNCGKLFRFEPPPRETVTQPH